MKFSVQPLINKVISKIPTIFVLFSHYVIDDVIYVMNLGNKYKIANFIIFSKIRVFMIF